VSSADVLIQNLAPGALDRLGLDSQSAVELNPQLIYVSISGYGRGGPAEQKKAYDLLVQCEAGLLSVTGTEQTPSKVGISIADIAAGMYAYSGVLAALIQRGKTGRGDILDISMLEALGEWMQQPYLYAEYGGTQQPRSGAQHATIAPYGPFNTSDGTVFFGIQNEREWNTFCAGVLANESVASDERFVSNSARIAHREDLHGLITEAFSQLSTEEALARLDHSDIANARLRNMHEFAGHPQLAARNRWREVEIPGGETAKSLLPPVSAQSYQPEMNAVPALGEHTQAVLKEFGLL
jgi:crotonobetainyl-CoA:carnitine CoA-transferase CaiB-like acyl-CoA transferase